MNAGDILDAIGLLDDSLIQEAEEYSRPRKQAGYRPWISLAACLAVVIALGYGAVRLTYLGGGNGSGAAPGQAGCASNESQGGSAPPPGAGIDNAPSEDQSPDVAEPDVDEPSAPGEDLAVVIEDVVYRSTGETVPLFPDGEDIRYDVSWYDLETEEAVSDPYLCCVVLEDGSVAVSSAFQSNGWLIFEPVS